MKDGYDAGVLVIVALIIVAAGLALGAAFAWFSVEVVGGHDISFREAVAIALLLSAAASNVSVTRD